ncbi:STAS domain-containing protein [Nocardioides sp. CPCC 205120]|uniref:STAS domain-containing protein n=1 Tax=Nocardioides sp. CPCC 205120 TaxID=3406462 RepID=UPI003B513989
MDQQERSLEITFDLASATVCVRGVVDVRGARNLRGFLEMAALTDVRRLVVDLAEVEQLHPAGVRELDGGVRVAHALGIAVEVRAPEGSVARRVLDHAGRPLR